MDILKNEDWGDARLCGCAPDGSICVEYQKGNIVIVIDRYVEYEKHGKPMGREILFAYTEVNLSESTTHIFCSDIEDVYTDKDHDKWWLCSTTESDCRIFLGPTPEIINEEAFYEN